MCNFSCVVNQDEFFIEDFDAAPLDTIDLYDMTFREDPSDFDDNLLYAARDRSRQLRSFKVLFLSCTNTQLCLFLNRTLLSRLNNAFPIH